MDQRKALFRSKLRESAQKRDKRIDSPLVRYNEYDQPTCRVCNITLKSESLWPAHQASRKHHEAIENLRAAASGPSRGNNANLQQSTEVQKTRSSTLPADFFDRQEAKRQKNNDTDYGRKEVAPPPVGQMVEVPGSVSNANESNNVSADTKEASEIKPSTDVRSMVGNFDRSKIKQVKRALPEGFFDSDKHGETTESDQADQPSKTASDLEVKQVQGTLPEGFFDNKDADLRARGIQPVKVDINDAYKEYEKNIQEDLKEIDDRLEEEEIDAAKEMQEFFTLEQREYTEKVDMIKNQLMEVKAARLARTNQRPAFVTNESSDESSSDGDGDDHDGDANFTVDWRAQHL